MLLLCFLFYIIKLVPACDFLSRIIRIAIGRQIRFTVREFIIYRINYVVYNTSKYRIRSMSIRIIHWAIITIGKHIIAKDSLSCRGQRIRVEESTNLGVVISGLEIVESILLIILLTL